MGEETEIEDSDQYREQRLTKMRKLEELGYSPYGRAYDRSGRLSEIRAAFEEEKVVRAAGRLLTIRDMGKSIFADLSDGSDRFQIYVQKNKLGEVCSIFILVSTISCLLMTVNLFCLDGNQSSC